MKERKLGRGLKMMPGDARRKLNKQFPSNVLKESLQALRAKASTRKARVSIVRVYGYNKCLDGLEVGQASIATTVMVSNMSTTRGWVLYSLGVRLCVTLWPLLC
jgi:hypothetical protein